MSRPRTDLLLKSGESVDAAFPTAARWPVRPLRAMATVQLGRQRSPDRAEGPNMVQYLRAANVKDGYLDLTDVKSMDFNLREQPVFALQPGDVLVTEGAGSLAAVGASAAWNGELDGVVCFQNTLLRLRPTRGNDAGYLMWWARHAYGSGLFAAVAGGANILHLGADTVRNLTSPNPPYAIQRAIADYLDTETARIDAIVHARRSMLALLDERLTAYTAQALRHAPRRLLRHSLTAVEQGWSPIAQDSAREDDRTWAVLKLSAVTGGTFRPGEHKILGQYPGPFARYEVHAGDVLITRANTPTLVGDAVYVGEVAPRLLIPDLVYRLRYRADIHGRYLGYVLRTQEVRDQIAAVARGSSQSMVKLRAADIAGLTVPLPSIDEQIRIADYLKKATVATDLHRHAISRQIKLLLERRQVLISSVVTGELDSPEVAT